MKNADLALYRAKADGGGTFRFFRTEMDARMQVRRTLELELRKAILKGEFELHYQPIVEVKTGRITSCEALIRWFHPERGMIPPLEFIPIAEETSLLFLLENGCCGTPVAKRSVGQKMSRSRSICRRRNSRIQSGQDHRQRADRLRTARSPAGAGNYRAVLLQDNDHALAILHELRNLGIKIAMDDFGTGYSSLGYLRSFPFDKIKIDQSFIRDLTSKERQRCHHSRRCRVEQQPGDHDHRGGCGNEGAAGAPHQGGLQ